MSVSPSLSFPFRQVLLYEMCASLLCAVCWRYCYNTWIGAYRASTQKLQHEWVTHILHTQTHKHAHIEKWYESLEERRTHTHTRSHKSNQNIRKEDEAIRWRIEEEGDEKERRLIQHSHKFRSRRSKVSESVHVCVCVFLQSIEGFCHLSPSF